MPVGSKISELSGTEELSRDSGSEIEQDLKEVLEFCQDCGAEVLKNEVVGGVFGLADKGIEGSIGQQADTAKLYEA